MQEGIFIKELKNRFLCEVSIDQEIFICYVPSSCRLSNFADFKGKKVLLKQNQNKNAKTKYALYAISHEDNYVIVNLKEANYVIEKNIKGKLFDYLGERVHTKREVTVENYKCDLFIEDTKTIIEIKSLLILNSEDEITQIHSERAITQLNSISSLLNKGYAVYYIFVSMNP